MIGRSESWADEPPHRERGVSPIVGLLALLAVTVALATIVAVGASTVSIGSTGPTAAFDLAVDGSTITIDHLAGDAIDVAALSVTIAVDGTELDSQPPVPFVGAEGFDGAPSGPFNAKSDRTWRSGTTAGVTVADTNAPEIERGDSVAVTLVVDGEAVATLETTSR
ncbi:type IV pilin N-terminal domain-containing protein [Halosolutus amylolyticus]|uniref:Type IV pilin N-terminal domain-containing protein n=1 Tax=Halosolutus amylolyticus TaxID=2932267 RepID=A0ABD5PQJ9_9EURY|nr:type IV pilin N-terminal domain-containing protein [Halosolutus amylolyticus]